MFFIRKFKYIMNIKIFFVYFLRLIFLSFFMYNISLNIVLGEDIEERFQGTDKMLYKVYFNGIPSGVIEWEYLGVEAVKGKDTHVLSLDADTKIFKLLNLTSNDKVFLDVETYLPLRVERDVTCFGKKEFIEETYNQKEGIVKILKDNSKEEEIIYQDVPIQNILALLYFFPENITLKQGEWMSFNLPTQIVKMKLLEERVLSIDKKTKTAYFIIGRGAKRFNLWLDKDDRMPLRLEFILPVGKVIIKRVSS
ncbi:MAG: hypothetical protein KAJ79_06045 [Candidatus Omnitrophica bacterium]|nr:hypothetical protein [Candidatus Omnitrophota bacterium]MCK5288608.1 hypothetical protein [Candidatus Omnitrophota bacterium]